MSKLLEEVRNTLRVHHYAIKTEKSYVQWIRRFILFHNKRHPVEMGKLEVEQFLIWLAVSREWAAFDGVLASTCDGVRSGSSKYYSLCRQGWQGPGHRLTRESSGGYPESSSPGRIGRAFPT